MERNINGTSSDAILWDNFRSGSEEAYSTIYEKYASLLYSYGCLKSSDKELVKDCLQDLFVNLWVTRHKLGATTSIKYYLFCCLRREIARKAKQYAVSEQESFFDAEDSYEVKWIEAEEQTYSSKFLENAMKQLSERQREAIYLRFYQKMEFEDIALLMEITPRAVYKLIYRAIDVLQKSYFSAQQSDFVIGYATNPQLQLITLLLIGLIVSGYN